MNVLFFPIFRRILKRNLKVWKKCWKENIYVCNVKNKHELKERKKNHASNFEYILFYQQALVTNTRKLNLFITNRSFLNNKMVYIDIIHKALVVMNNKFYNWYIYYGQSLVNNNTKIKFSINQNDRFLNVPYFFNAIAFKICEKRNI